VILINYVILPPILEMIYQAKLEEIGQKQLFGQTMFCCVLAGVFAMIWPSKGWWFLLVTLNLAHLVAGFLLQPNWK